MSLHIVAYTPFHFQVGDMLNQLYLYLFQLYLFYDSKLSARLLVSISLITSVIDYILIPTMMNVTLQYYIMKAKSSETFLFYWQIGPGCLVVVE